MENLKMPVTHILLNGVTTADVGLYEDYFQKRKILKFKKFGLDLPGQLYTGGGLLPVIGAAGLSENVQVSKSCTDDGKLTAIAVELDPGNPCLECDWEFGLTIRERVKMPGVGNNKTNVSTKSYGGVIPKITLTNGVIDDVWLLEAEDKIISDISSDVGTGGNTDPVSSQSGSNVLAYRMYTIRTTNAATDTLVITKTADGTSETIDLDGGATVITALDDLNTDETFGVTAIAKNATDIYVFSTQPGLLFTIAGGVGVTVLRREILLVAKSVHSQFSVTTERGFATQRGIWRYVIDGTTATTTLLSAVYNVIDGPRVVEDPTAAGAIPALKTEFNTTDGLAAAGAYMSTLTAAGTDINIVADTEKFQSFNVTLGATSTLLETDLEWSPTGKFPSYTSDDIFRMFWNQTDQGSLGAMSYGSQPVQGDHYCVYTIKIKNIPISALHGASYRTFKEFNMVVAVRKSVVNTNVWDKTDPASAGLRYSYMEESTVTGFVADTTFEELLGIWCGLAPVDW